LASARNLLAGASFLSLWDGALAIYGRTRCELLTARAPLPADEDAILLRLNRYLEALSRGFGLPEPVSQLPLVTSVGLHGPSERRRAKAGRA